VRPAAGEPAARTAFAKLRRVVYDLRSGVFSATVALNLMNIIAESVERAVLFLVRRESLTALGAFGFNAAERPLAEATRGLAVPLEEGSAFTEAIRAGRALSVSFDEAGIPEGLRQVLGAPKTGQVVLFPVLGSDRVILLIYTDNGALDRPIEEIDIIDLAAAEVGIAFENEMLRRQLSNQSTAPKARGDVVERASGLPGGRVINTRG
jgi:GAF domain-containing protein